VSPTVLPVDRNGNVLHAGDTVSISATVHALYKGGAELQIALLDGSTGNFINQQWSSTKVVGDSLNISCIVRGFNSSNDVAICELSDTNRISVPCLLVN
jgi:hypothetical protein